MKSVILVTDVLKMVEPHAGTYANHPKHLSYTAGEPQPAYA